MNLLIVDDHAINRKLLRAQLESEGHGVLDAADGVEALEVLEREKSVEGVISDILMPKMDGFRLCLEIRKNPTFAALPFIVYTSTYDSPEDRQLAKSVGADHYLTKPAPVAEILGALRDAAQLTRPRIARLAAKQDESYVLKQYNASLVRKLEERNIEVEEALKNLQLAHDSTQKSEQRFRAIFDHAGIGITMRPAHDRKLPWVQVNDHFCKLLGYTRDELLKLNTTDITPSDEQAGAVSDNQRLLIGDIAGYSREKQIICKDGRRIWVVLTVTSLPGPDGRPANLISTYQDITARKAADEKIKRLNRVYAVLSGINTLIVRVHDSQELFNEACRIVVEVGELRMAWIGVVNRGEIRVDPVASVGADAEFLSAVRDRFNLGEDTALGNTLTARAIRNKKAFVSNDIENDPSVAFGKRHVERGIRSMAILPLLVSDETLGVLALYAQEVGFFDDEELKLLTELAGDISFALANISRQRKLDKLARIRAVSGEINAAILRVRDRQELLDATCNIAVEQAGFPLAWIGMLDPATLDLKPAAVAGTVLEYAKLLAPSIRADIPAGQGTNGRAFREKKPVVDNDMTANPNAGFMRVEALKRGIQAAISLPLLVEGAPVGVLGLYTREKDYFDDEEISLLTEVAGNISFALEHINRQRKLDKLSRIRAVSSEINAAIVRIRERKALLEEACRIASKQGKFEMVWIGTIDAEKQEIRPVAWTGFSLETAHKVSWKSTTAVRGTLGEAVRTRKLAVRNDIASELPGGGLRQEAVSRGCRSTVCLPLVVGDGVVALVVLFASGTAFFDADELALLEEVAADLSFALAHIASEEKLDYLSYYDPITGLPNRTLFIDRAGQQMRSRGGEPLLVAVILFNLERFRNINETFGRHGGDELLKLVAQRLEAAFRGKDYLARIGADIFGVVTRGIRDAAAVAHLVENQVLGCFREAYTLNGSELRVAAKAGIAVFPADGSDADNLFRNAEAALKKARDSGEHYLFYAADMNARAAQALSLETRLRKAVEAQQFVLHYQPKIELASDTICGMEALIRWQEPGAGLVAPGSFIPLLEETGLILDVGKWALGQALADHREWTARGCTVPRIAVNVSAVQLQRKDFADMVVGVVQQQGANPDALELEVTESLLMKDVQESIRKLSILRGQGIHIAMDDFGTGYSSLSYIARLPINSVKIDRSFINGMAGNPQDMSIVSTIITLAHSLNLRVVAEGVETAEQSKLLLLLKCEEAQGFLFSKPRPAAEIELLLRAPA